MTSYFDLSIVDGTAKLLTVVNRDRRKHAAA
jgi:hypothetical protein